MKIFALLFFIPFAVSAQVKVHAEDYQQYLEEYLMTLNFCVEDGDCDEMLTQRKEIDKVELDGARTPQMEQTLKEIQRKTVEAQGKILQMQNDLIEAGAGLE